MICGKRYGLQVRVRSGGHDYEGLSYTSNNPFVVLDLVNLRKVSVDVEDQTAWVEAGATVGELYYQIANKSGTLGFPAGTCPTIGVGGHISGGGQGTLTRKYGLSADHVVDAVLVDVHGRVLNRVSMGEDLFWAIRGGGGASFGVIISWKVKLVPVPPQVTVFSIMKTLEQNATHLTQRWQQIADKLDEDIIIRVVLQPGGAVFNSLYLGTVDHLIPLMEASFPELGLEAANCTQLSWIESILYIDAGGVSEEPIEVLMNRTRNPKGIFKAKSDFVEEPILVDDLEVIWGLFNDSEAGVMILEPYGGRMNEISDTETPFPHRNGTLYNIQYFSSWEDDAVTSQRLKWINNLYNFMGPLVSKNPRGAYLNYRDLDLGMKKDGNPSYEEAQIWGGKYFKNNFERLARVKGMVDPNNFFKNEQGIPPLKF